jgi:hypothetical protein
MTLMHTCTMHFEHVFQVREACCMLDLTVSMRPCPQGGDAFRQALVARGGKGQVPYMVSGYMPLCMSCVVQFVVQFILYRR